MVFFPAFFLPAVSPGFVLNVSGQRLLVGEPRIRNFGAVEVFFCVASLSLAVVVPRILNFGADILYLLFHTTIIPQQLLDPVLFTCIHRIPHIIRQQAVN